MNKGNSKTQRAWLGAGVPFGRSHPERSVTEITLALGFSEACSFSVASDKAPGTL
jgi:hypothetical protein